MITVFGSINIDLVFRTARLPAPGETMLCPRYESFAGGKGANQALAAARAGATVHMVGRVGRDAFADPALALLKTAGVDLSAVVAGEAPTGCATVMVDDAGENAIVVASGANLEVSADQLTEAALNPETILVLQMEVPFGENWKAVERARASGARVALSVAPAAPVPIDVLNAVDILLVNEIEGRMVAEASGLSDAPLDELPNQLAARHGCLCVLTLGSKGVLAADPSTRWRVPALPLETVVDTTGAGDAFAGCLVAALDRGMETEAALHFAAIAAGLSCTALGAQTSFPDTVAISRRMSVLARR